MMISRSLRLTSYLLDSQAPDFRGDLPPNGISRAIADQYSSDGSQDGYFLPIDIASLGNICRILSFPEFRFISSEACFLLLPIKTECDDHLWPLKAEGVDIGSLFHKQD
jgi:hypothetical protein